MTPFHRKLLRLAALLPLSLSLSLNLLMPAQAAGSVEVRWVEPARFSDVSRNPVDRDHELQALGQYISQLGSRLPDGQTLLIEVTDLNLAGELQPFSWRDARVLRGGADWPRMELRYSLQAGGRTLQSGQAQLSDMNYFFGLRNSERLGYEKRMVERWFKDQFLTP